MPKARVGGTSQKFRPTGIPLATMLTVGNRNDVTPANPADPGRPPIRGKAGQPPYGVARSDNDGFRGNVCMC